MTKRKSKFSPFLKQCFVTGAVCTNIASHGCAFGFPGILLPQLQQAQSEISLTEAQASWIPSVLGIVMALGAFIMLPLLQGSRKIAHYAVIVPGLIGWVSTIFATNFLGLFIGRILSGLSFGMMVPLRSALIGEYTSPKNRGAFLTVVTLAQAFGIFLVHLLGSFLNWRTTAIISITFSIISLVMTIFSPESPIWLASKGRYDECRKIFRWLRGDEEEDELEAMIHAQMTQKNVVNKSDKKLKSIGETIKKKEFFKPIIIMAHANILQQFAGGTTMASYSTRILGLIMGPTANVHFWMVFLDAQRLLCNAGAVYIINRTKRRTMLFSTGALSVASHLAIAAYVMATKGDDSKSIWISAILINIQFFTVAVGMLPIPNVIAGEVFPLQYKGIGGMISMISLSSFFFGVLQTFPPLVDSIGIDGTYVVYAGMLTYNLVVIWFLLPETKGKTLLEIEEEFRGRPFDPEEIAARKSLEGEAVVELQELRRQYDINSDLASKPFLN